jgi:hypothetical protein
VDKRILGGNKQGAIGHALNGYDCGEPGARGKEIRVSNAKRKRKYL